MSEDELKKAKKKVAKATKKKVTRKKTAKKKKKVSKKKSVKKVAKKAILKQSTPTISDQERYEMIRTRAYFIAQSRGFEPGHEEEDWLEAERFIDEILKR